MKKYVKPDVLFEDFEMSVGVAACTGVIIGSDGNPKDMSDPRIQQLVGYGLFSEQCGLNINDSDNYGYFGGIIDIFGS